MINVMKLGDKTIGENDDRIGFGSYCLTNVFNWREQYLEIVNKEDK